MNRSSLVFIGLLLMAPLTVHAEDAGFQVQQTIPFATNTAKLGPTAEKKLREDIETLSTLLRYRPESSIEIAGYAAASEKKPGPLADSRAQKVWEFLIAQGLPAERMEPVGHGAAAGSGSSRVDIRISSEDMQAMNQASQLLASPAPAPAATPETPTAAVVPAEPAPTPSAPAAVATPSAPTPAGPSPAEQAAQAKRDAAEAKRQAAAEAAEAKRQAAAEAAAAKHAQAEEIKRQKAEAAELKRQQQAEALERKQAEAEARRQAAAEAAAKKAEAAEAARQEKLRVAEERKAAQQAAAEARRQAQAEARAKAQQAALEKKQAAEAARKAAEQAAIQHAMNTPPPTLTPEATDKALLTEKGKKIIDNQTGPSYVAPPSQKAPPKSALPGEGSYFIQGTAYFSANARTLTPGSSATIDALAVRVQKLIAARPNVKVDIVGHADPLTEGQQADVLAEGRAEELMKELVARGVDREHLHPAGAADSQPLTSKKNDPARNLNMRAEIRVPTS